MANKTVPISKSRTFRDSDLESSMGEIYRALGKVFLGPYKFVYNNQYDKLYLQVVSGASWTTIASLDSSGNLCIGGTITQSATFPDVG